MIRKLKFQISCWKNTRMFKKLLLQERYSYYLKHVDKKDNIPTNISKITIYDKLDNHGMNILLKKIHSLKKRRGYSVSTNYRKPGARDLNYIAGNLEGYSFFSIADIKATKDKWINSISISGTYVTNSEVIVEYTIWIKKRISSYIAMHEFVLDHQKGIGKYKFHSSFAYIEKVSFSWLAQQEEQVFYDCFQNYICRMFYTDFGKNHPLPMEIHSRIMGYNKNKEKKIIKSFLSTVYKHENEIVVIPYQERFFAVHYFHGKYIHGTGIFDFFAKFSVEMYYMAFRKIELFELEQKMRKYINSRKRAIKTKDIKWMINKLRGIEEKEERLISEISRNAETSKWEKYDQGKWIKEDLIQNNNISSRFKTLYKQNLDYLQAISTTRNNRVIYIITIISLIVTSIGLAISFFSLNKKEEEPKTNNYNLYYTDKRETNEYRYSIFD